MLLVLSLIVMIAACEKDDGPEPNDPNPPGNPDGTAQDSVPPVSPRDSVPPEVPQDSVPPIDGEDPKTPRLGVINVDIMGHIDPAFGDVVHVGDDGVLSSSSGMYWNPGSSSVQTFEDISDEFNIPTTVDIYMTVTGTLEFDYDLIENELQGTGISTSIPEQGFEWQGLIADSEYDLSFYIHAYDRFKDTTTFDITHAGGTISTEPNEEPTWILPGEVDRDYILIEKIKPYEISNGVYGFKIDNIHSVNERSSAIYGFQLKGLIIDL